MRSRPAAVALMPEELREVPERLLIADDFDAVCLGVLHERLEFLGPEAAALRPDLGCFVNAN